MTERRTYTGEREVETEAAERELFDAIFVYQAQIASWYFTAKPGTPFPELRDVS